MVTEIKRRLLKMREVAPVYGCSTWFWRCRVWEGALPVFVVGKTQYLDTEDLDEFIRKNKHFGITRTRLLGE